MKKKKNPNAALEGRFYKEYRIRFHGKALSRQDIADLANKALSHLKKIQDDLQGMHDSHQINTENGMILQRSLQATKNTLDDLLYELEDKE